MEINVLDKLSSITEIIRKALTNNVISNDIMKLIDDINYFEMENIPDCEYKEDINLILQHRNTIIEEVNNHILADE